MGKHAIECQLLEEEKLLHTFSTAISFASAGATPPLALPSALDDLLRWGSEDLWGEEEALERVRAHFFALWDAASREVCPDVANPSTCREDSCSGHGRCSDVGVCLCVGDWFGDTCDHHPFLNSSYLPREFHLSSPSTCPAVVKWSIGSSGLVELLDQLQARRCEEKHPLLLDTLGLALGGQINLASLALAHALNQNRSFLLHGRWRYGSHAGCLRQGRACYFQAKLACEEERLRSNGVRVWPFKDGGAVLEHFNTREVRGGLVAAGRLRVQGLFWWTSHLLAYVTRPSSDLEAKLRALRLQLNFAPPLLGLHVRHGDACVHAAQSNTRPLCRPLADYIPAVLKLRRAYGLEAVFLSTDDEEVVEDATRWLRRHGMRVLNLPLDRSVFESSWFIEHRMEAGALDAGVITDSMLLDLLLLRECDAFVGTLSSQMSRLALSLMAHRIGVIPPFVSVEDMPWGCCSWAGESLEQMDDEAMRRVSFGYKEQL